MKLSTTIASATVAGVLGLAGVSVAGAAATGSTSTTVAPSPGGAKTPATGAGARSKRAARRRQRRREIAVVAAHTIGIKPRELVRELRGGKTIAQVATEHGVQPQTVIEALERAAAARIDAAQAAGKITAERAARMRQRVDVAIPRIVNDWHPRPKPAG